MIDHVLHHESLLEVIIESYVFGETGTERLKTGYIPQIVTNMGIKSYQRFNFLTRSMDLFAANRSKG